MFEVYNPIRKQWKRIEIDTVPSFFARKLIRAYTHSLVTAADAREISERLRMKIPFLGFNNYEEYTNADTQDMIKNQNAFWQLLQQPRTLSELIHARLIDCNVLSLAIQQVIPNTEVYFKSSHTDATTKTYTTRHTFTTHPRNNYFLCIDPVNSRRNLDAFFRQEKLCDSYTKVKL